jgi:hypothetical protein
MDNLSRTRAICPGDGVSPPSSNAAHSSMREAPPSCAAKAEASELAAISSFADIASTTCRLPVLVWSSGSDGDDAIATAIQNSIHWQRAVIMQKNMKHLAWSGPMLWPSATGPWTRPVRTQLRQPCSEKNPSIGNNQ